jgi:hypothetical protein
MRTAPIFARSILAAALALLMAIRLLTPNGFMPVFDRGAVTIVACPDGEVGGAGPTGHHSDHSRKFHQLCPYAAASGFGSLAPDVAPLLALLIISAALLLGRTFQFLEWSRAHERPPLRGPPLPA